MFIKNCCEKLKPSEDRLSKLNKDNEKDKQLILREARRITLCLKALREYVSESDINFSGERGLLPHFR